MHGVTTTPATDADLVEELPRAFQKEDLGGGLILEELACFDGAHEAPGPAADDDDSTGVRRVSGVGVCCAEGEAAVTRGRGGGEEEGWRCSFSSWCRGAGCGQAAQGEEEGKEDEEATAS